MICISDFIFECAKTSTWPNILFFQPSQGLIYYFIPVHGRYWEPMRHLEKNINFHQNLTEGRRPRPRPRLCPRLRWPGNTDFSLIVTCVTCIDTISSFDLSRPTPKQSIMTWRDTFEHFSWRISFYNQLTPVEPFSTLFRVIYIFFYHFKSPLFLNVNNLFYYSIRNWSLYYETKLESRFCQMLKMSFHINPY